MESIEKIKEFLKVDNGFGFSYGYGYGDGSGYGYGDGSGSGYGDGYGDGDGSGYGYGDGSGYGYGDGSGDGYGDGDGIKNFNGTQVYMIDAVPTIITKTKRNVAKGYILNSDFTLDECYIVKSNRLFAHGKTLREAQTALEEKIFNNLDSEERISLFVEHFALNKKYPAKEFYTWHNKLTGSCEIGRKAFAKAHNIDIEKDYMTVQEFIKLTKDSYGRTIILELEKEITKYKIMDKNKKQVQQKQNDIREQEIEEKQKHIDIDDEIQDFIEDVEFDLI